MISGKVLSIDIGSRNMHLVEGRSRGNTVELDHCVLVPTPEGALKDGIIEDRAAMSIALRDALKDNNLTAKRAIITIKSSTVVSREITVPVVRAEEQTSLVLLDMEQYVPNIANDYVTGFIEIEKTSGPAGEQNKLRVSAVSKQLVESYMNMLKDAGLKPLVMDLHANAAAKLIKKCQAAQEDKGGTWTWQTAAFIDLGYDITEVNIFAKGRLVFSRQIQFGSHQLDEELGGALNINKSVTERKKETLCDLSQMNFSSAEASTLNEVIRSFVNRWINEIQTVLQFYSGRVAENRPEAFYLYGGSARLTNLPDYMRRSVGVPVYAIGELPAVQLTNKSEAFDAALFFNAAAAILRND